MSVAAISVEVVSWVTRFVGGDKFGHRVFLEVWTPDSTVQNVLVGLSARFSGLQRVLWHGNELGEEDIEVLVNDAVLGVHRQEDSPVKPEDQITLIGQHMDG